MNIVILKGNLTRDPEARSVQVAERATIVTNFTLAVNRHYKRADGTRDKETTFVDCEAWDTGAETISKYVKKGDPLLVRGGLKLDTWEVDGQKRSRIKVRVTEFELLYRSSNKENQANTVAQDTDDPGASDGMPVPF